MVFLKDFHICHQHRGEGEDFISGAKSFKVNLLGSKSGSVISFKLSKTDCVQILVLALVLPRGISCAFSFLCLNYPFLK